MKRNNRRVGPTFPGAAFGAILAILFLSTIVSAQGPVSFTLTTDKEKYVFNETVHLRATLAGVPPDGNVTFEVDDSKDNPVLILTVPLNRSGVASTQFRLVEDQFPIGRYEIIAMAKVMNATIKSTKFISVLKDEGEKEGNPFQPAVIGGAVVITGVVLGLAIIASTEAGKFGLMTSLVLPLYSRLKHKEVRDQVTRGKILGYLTAAGDGAHYSDIKKGLGLENGSASYHLDRLEKEGLIISRRQGIYKIFYLKAQKASGVKKMSHTGDSLVELIKERPGITQKEICKETGLKQTTVSYNLTKMVRNGEIESTDENGIIYYYPRAELSSSPRTDELTNDERLKILEDRFLKGEISEETYKDLKKKFRRDLD